MIPAWNQHLALAKPIIYRVRGRYGSPGNKFRWADCFDGPAAGVAYLAAGSSCNSALKRVAVCLLCPLRECGFAFFGSPGLSAGLPTRPTLPPSHRRELETAVSEADEMLKAPMRLGDETERDRNGRRRFIVTDLCNWQTGLSTDRTPIR